MMGEWVVFQEAPDQSGLRRSPREHPNCSPLIFFFWQNDFNSVCKGLRPKAEDKGSRQMVTGFLGDWGQTDEVDGGETGGGKGNADKKAWGKPLPALSSPPSPPPDVPMSPRVKRTDSHCPQTPEEVGTVIVPLSGWRTEGQKDELSQKNRAAHQTHRFHNCP